MKYDKGICVAMMSSAECVTRSQELYGGEVQYFRLDPEYWPTMLENLKNAGGRCVTAYVPWGTHAIGVPDANHPAGQLDFSGSSDPRLNLIAFLDLVEEFGLNLNVRCGPFCCAELVHGGYPGWLLMDDPEMMVWDYQNRTARGYWIAKEEGSQPSYLHPRYLSLCENWIREVDKVILPHLKVSGGCVTVINLDNEVSYIVQDGFLSSDYNPVNVRAGGFYHRFLSQKYGKIDNLPYSAKYERFEDIPAPRAIPEDISDDIKYYLDWCEFKTWVMAEYLRCLRDMHTQNGVTDVIFTTNLNPHRPEGVPTRMSEFEEAVSGIVGYDFYRGTFMSYSGYQSMARVLKLMNASLNYTWSPEFMAGTWNKVLPTRVSDDHMRFMVRCALAHGCKTINWYMIHDRDCWGDAPVSSHGHLRPSIEVIRETAELICETLGDWESLEPQCDVAVIYDLIQHQHTYVGDPFPCQDEKLHIGLPTICGIEAGKASTEYEGLFRLVEQAGYQAAAVDIMFNPESLKRYGVAFLPGSPVIERAAAKVLQDYVEGGGTLVVCGSWPLVDELGRGVSFLGVDPASAENGLCWERGQGRVVWRADYLAQEQPEQEKLSSVDLVADIIKSSGVIPAVHIKPVVPVSWIDWREGSPVSQVYVQPRNLASAVLQVSPSGTILFVMNHYPEAALFELRFGCVDYAKITNVDTGQDIDITDGSATVDIDRKSCAIYRVTKTIS